jgi:hypothetical protein
MQKDLSQNKTYELGHEARQEVGLFIHLVADLRPGFQGLGWAFFALLCDPTLPIVSVLELGRS